MERLDGQVAIVTGGARGIGAGIARVLRDEGATLLIADQDGSAAQECAASLDPHGTNAAALAVDVTDRGDLSALVTAALERWGRIDILAANAGIYPHIPFSELTPGDFDELMAINVRGAVFAAQACSGPMRDRRTVGSFSPPRLRAQ